MKTWDIWIEGYVATGNTAGHRLMGKAEGNTFREAVINFTNSDKANSWGTFNEDRLSFWGCRVFDNHEDAAKAFG